MPYLSTQPLRSELPQNFTFDDLAAYEEARRRELIPQFQERLRTLRTGLQSQYDKNLENYRNLTAGRRTSLANSLADQSRQAFQMQNPYILEDLNRRGLMSSPTATAQAQAQALKELELQNQDTLNQFDTESRNYQDAIEKQRLQDLNDIQTLESQGAFDLEQNALNQALDVRRSELERSIQESDAAREEALARDLAKQQRKQSLTESLLGAGTNLLGIGLMTRGGGGGATTGSGGLLSGLTGGGSTPLGRLFGGGGGGSVSTAGGGSVTANGGQVIAGGSKLAGFGSLLGGAGAGLLGSSLGRRSFGGGNDTGSVVGGGLGYLMGGPLGAGVGSYLGTGAQRLGENIYEQSKNKVGNTAASVIKPFVDPAGAVKSVSKAVKKVFCFDGLTPIEMKNGTFKPICEIDLDDETRGGTVESVRVSKVSDGSVFNYKGVIVTGYHAVKEGNVWVRVKDSLFGEKLDGDETVFSIVTSDHRVFVNNIEFSDEIEHDNYEELTIDESLNLLNKDLVGVN